MTVKTLPHSLEAESTVLGAVFLRPKTLCDLRAVLDPGDFYHPVNAAIYSAFVTLEESKRPIDTLTVAGELKRAAPNILKGVGETYLGELMSGVVTIENLGYHAKQIEGLARARRLIEAAHGVIDRGYEIHGDVGGFLERAESEVASAIGAPREVEYHTMADMMRRTYAEAEKKATAKHRISVPWGFRDLDDLTLGAEPGDLVIIGGRAKLGKTCLAMASVEQIALSTDAIPQLIISLEMSDTQLGQRQAASVGGIRAINIRDAKSLTPDDWKAFSAAVSRLAAAPIWCYARPASMPQIKSIARRWRMRETDRKRPARVVVDYLGRIKSTGRSRNVSREEEIAGLTNDLKDLAVEENVVLTCLAQINRAAEQESDRRPQLLHLRGSGAIEADADQVALLYRDDYYYPDSDDAGILEVAIAAHRNGPTGVVALAFDTEKMQIRDLPRAAIEAWRERRIPRKPPSQMRKKRSSLPPDYTEPHSRGEDV